jgi:Spy/CpxP family protein refolding chaperone
MKTIAKRLFVVGILCAGMGVGWSQALSVPGRMTMGEPRGIERGAAIEARGMEHGATSLGPMLSLPGMQGRWWVIPRIAESLKISEEQQKAMDGILIEHREKLIDLRAGLQKAELKMEQLAEADKLDEGAITGQIDRVAQARAELEKANAHYLLAIWGKLTPEQRTQVKQYRAGKMGREYMERGGPMPQHMKRPMPGMMPQPVPGTAPQTVPGTPDAK